MIFVFYFSNWEDGWVGRDPNWKNSIIFFKFFLKSSLNMLIWVAFLGDFWHYWRNQNVIEIQFYLLGIIISTEKSFKCFQLKIGFLRLTLPEFWKSGKVWLFCRTILNMTFRLCKKITHNCPLTVNPLWNLLIRI